MDIYHTVLQLTLLVAFASASNILFFMPFGSPSHGFVMAPVMEGLQRKGHNITFLTMHPIKHEFQKNFKMVQLENVKKAFDEMRPNYFMLQNFNLSYIYEFIHMAPRKTCEALITDPGFQSQVTDKSLKYDLVVLDTLLSECGFVIVPLLGSPPVILFATTAIYPWTSWALNIPTPLSYVPFVMFPVSLPMGFFDRLLNAFGFTFYMLLRHYDVFPSVQNVVESHFPNLPQLTEIEKNASLVLANSHSGSLDLTQPLAPNVIEIGSIHCKPAKPLQEELESFIRGAGEHGFILFSLGSHIPAADMGKEKQSAFLKAFSRLKQRVLWKFDIEIPNAPPNVLIRKWLPQQDLLGHPKIHAFMTHCGQLSLQEIVYHTVPALVVPVIGDQFVNMQVVVKNGFGESLLFKDLHEDVIYQKLMKLLSNSSYKEQLIKFKALMEDRPISSMDTALYWVEYVIRHKGAHHLGLKGASHLNLFQYFLLDIVAVIVIVFLIICYSLVKIYTCIRGRCSKPKPKKTKVKTK